MAMRSGNTSTDIGRAPAVETGALYTTLYRLRQGLNRGVWELCDKGKRARYYRMTTKGRKQLVIEQSKWETFTRAMGLMLKPAEEKRRMTPLVRQGAVVAAAQSKEKELREELRVHLEAETDETPGRRIVGR